MNKETKISNAGPVSSAAALLASGWREYPNRFKEPSRCFYKKFETKSVCNCNSDKPGMQIELSLSNYMEHESIELTLCAELPDGTWLSLLNYGLPKTIDEVTKLIPRLLAIWEAANQAGETE